MKWLNGFFDSSVGSLIVLSLAVGALFLVYKGVASYLPSGGFGGALKRMVNAL